MIKTLIFFAALLAIAWGGSWLAEHPGTIVVNWPWLDAAIEVSLLMGVLAGGALVVLTIVGWVILRSLWLSPQALSGFFSGRRRDKGYKALSTGMIAVGVGDLALAQKQATKAKKLIGEEPMTLMLEAQTAQLAGNATQARQSFEAMLDNDETRGLGRRGLYIEAQRRGDAEEAMQMAKSATEEGKKAANWAGAALFDMQTAAEDWKGALLTLSQNQANKYLSKEEFRRKRAVLLTAQAIELEEKGSASLEDRKHLLLEACKLAPDLVPAAAMAGDLLNESKDYRKARKIVEAAWRAQPHPELAAVYAIIKTGDTALDRLKAVRSLYGLMPDDVEAKLAMARAAIDAREWPEARSILEPMAEDRLTPRICMLMAEVEEGENGDFGKVRQWLARAVGAHRDPVWTADGQVSEDWKATSPVTGKLDAFEWRVPVQELAQSHRPMLENEDVTSAEDGDGEELVLLPTSDATEAPVTEAELDEATKADDAIEVKTEDAGVMEEKADIVLEAEPIDAETTEGDQLVEAEADGDEAAPAKHDGTRSENEAKEVEFALPHAPDDPGPKKEPLPNSPEKRFRLF